MLHKIKYIMVALALLVGTSSCLEKLPQSAIQEKDAMTSFSDAEQVLTGIYASLKNSVLHSGALTLLPDIQADQVHAVVGNSNVYGNFWQWDIRSTSQEVIGIYAQLYTVIGNCNFFLDQAEAVRKTLSTDAQFDLFDVYLGEVYFLRAFAYSELLKCYCKAYPATDAEAKGMLGVVLSTSYFEPTAPRRASLYDSYQLVLSDLDKAMMLLNEDDDAANNIYASAGAAQALSARTALYMQKWDDAVIYSTMLINREKYDVFSLADARVTSTTSGMNDYATMWSYDQSTEIIWRLGFTPTSYGGSLGQVFFNFTIDYANFYPDYVPSETVLNLYTAGDLRINANFAETPTGYPHGLTWPLLLKYYGNRSFMQTNIFGLTMPKLFRLSEQYLIRAEAYCRLKNFSAANKDVVAMRRYRFSSGGGGVNLEEKNWLEEISKERQRELYMEGFRLQDLKRWGLGFERKDQIEAQEEAATLKIDKNNPLFVWPIPQHELEAPGSEILPNESN